MRLAIGMIAAAVTWAAPHQLYVTGANSKGYVVGARLGPSGAWVREGDTFRHLGYNHPQISAIAGDPRNPRVLYIAAGNGCFRTADAGRTWRLLTSWQVTELQDVAVDPQRPDTVYIAHTAGVSVSRDEGVSWTAVNPAPVRAYAQTVETDRTRAGRVFAGGEQGLFVSDDTGVSWRRVLETPMITDVQQSAVDPAFWVATTQKAGAFASSDGGLTWTRIYESRKTVQNVTLAGDKIAIGGWDVGVLVSMDRGRTWSDRSAGLPSKQVWRVALDPDRPNRIYAGVHEDALYRSDDEGKTWKSDGLPGSVVTSLTFVPTNDFHARIEQVIGASANLSPGGFGTVAAKLRSGQDAEWASRRFVELLKEPTGDMFWMFPVTAIAYLGRDQLSSEAETALRSAWRTYMPYRGDTENHWLLYYTCLYLMAQRWPDEPAESWYTGKSSEANLREAEQWILSWMDLTTTRGQGEYDCTHYIGVYLLPMSYLAEWSEDPSMRQRARMMLDYLIADYAVENLNGLYTGSHARTDDRQVLEKWNGVSSDFGWALFGLGYPLPGYSSYLFWYSVASGYQPPEVIRQIATDRSKPYVHRELKRTRHRWRFNDERNGPVYKSTYMTKDYAVGSDQGGVLQPIQQHSWDVTWAVSDPRGVRNTLFAIHPYSSIDELQTYFTFQPDAATEAVVRSKKTYDSPDKFLGGSPYEQIVQDRDAVVALYDIPEGTRWPHVHAFFSKDLAEVATDRSGWLFARGGRTWIAYYPLAPWEWRPIEEGKEGAGSRRLFSPHLKNGAIVQAASQDEYPTLDAFKKAVLALPLQAATTPVPSVTFRTLRGATIEARYGARPKIDGVEVRYEDWKLFDGPFLEAGKGSRRLTLTHGKLRRTLDFAAATVKDE